MEPEGAELVQHLRPEHRPDQDAFLRPDRITMIGRLGEMDHLAAFELGPHVVGVAGMIGDGENVTAAGLQHAEDFGVSVVRARHVLEYVARHQQVQALVFER